MFDNLGGIHVAALSGEQRRPPYLNHCAVNTKAESNRKCQALGIRLKRLIWTPLNTSMFRLDCVGGESNYLVIRNLLHV